MAEYYGSSEDNGGCGGTVFIEMGQRALVENSLKLLNSFKRNEDLFDSYDSFKSINLIYTITNHNVKECNEFVDWNVFAEKNAADLFQRMLSHILKHISALEFSLIEKTVYKNLETFKLDLRKRFSCSLFLLIRIIYNVVRKLVEFNIKFTSNGGLDTLFAYLNDSMFCKKLAVTSNVDIIDTIVRILYFLSKNSEFYKLIWTYHLKSAQVLLRIAKTYPITELSVHCILANVLDDAQMESLPEINVICDKFVSELNKCANDFDAKRFNRHQIDLIEGYTVRCYQAHYMEQQQQPNHQQMDACGSGTVCIMTILTGLYQLAVNEKLRGQLIRKYKLKYPLKQIFYGGNSIERYYTLKLLYQLCFDSSLCNELRSDEKFIKHLRELSVDQKSDGSGNRLNRLSANLLKWIQNEQRLAKLLNKNKNKNNSTDNKQLFICYDYNDREICRRIKDNLECHGYKVWLGGENPNAATNLDAIEASKLVILCLNEKFRQNVNCHAETIHAFKLKKPMVSLVLQQHYDNVTSGWLKQVNPNKFSIDFTQTNNANMSTAINLLRSDLIENPDVYKSDEDEKPDYSKLPRLIKGISNTNFAQPNDESGAAQPKRRSVRDWDNVEVKSWFLENKVDAALVFDLTPCNGEALEQLYKVKCEAPEFFYHSLRANNSWYIDLKSLINFGNKLSELFESSSYASSSQSSS